MPIRHVQSGHGGFLLVVAKRTTGCAGGSKKLSLYPEKVSEQSEEPLLRAAEEKAGSLGGEK